MRSFGMIGDGRANATVLLVSNAMTACAGTNRWTLLLDTNVPENLGDRTIRLRVGYG